MFTCPIVYLVRVIFQTISLNKVNTHEVTKYYIYFNTKLNKKKSNVCA